MLIFALLNTKIFTPVEMWLAPINSPTPPLTNRRVRRMLSNRESARRSRRRKQAHLGELQLKVDQLQRENQDLLNKLHQLHVSFNSMMARNRMIKDNMAYLRMQIMSGEPLSREALVAATQAVAAGAQTNLQDLNHLVVGGPGAGINPMLMMSPLQFSASLSDSHGKPVKVSDGE